MERQEGDGEDDGEDDDFDEVDEPFDEEFEALDEDFDFDFDFEFDEPTSPASPAGEDETGGKTAGRPVCASSTLLAESRHTSTGTSVWAGWSRKEKEDGESWTTEGCAGA